MPSTCALFSPIKHAVSANQSAIIQPIISLPHPQIKPFLFSKITRSNVIISLNCMGESWQRLWVETECCEVCTHDRGQDSPIQTDLPRLIRCLLYGKEENLKLFDVTGLLTCWLANADELNLNLPKFPRPLYFFWLFGTFINDWEENQKVVNIFVFWFATFSYFSLLLFNAIWN